MIGGPQPLKAEPTRLKIRSLVTHNTFLVVCFSHCDHTGFGMETAMKTLLTCIAFVVGMVFCTQAFADNGGSRCPNMAFKNGHYVCGNLADNE